MLDADKTKISLWPEILIAILAVAVMWGGAYWLGSRIDARHDQLIAALQEDRPGVSRK